ncbi:MAG TPA: STAS domain-containing protein [Pirellulales bacterium]|nr:STAS domain-containing protein [Pirellulales bacterium]
MIQLKLLTQDGDLVRIESEGLAPRDGANVSAGRFESLAGEAIYSRKVLLGLSKCHYVDSMCIEWLLRSHRRFRESGGMLVLHSASPVVVQILNLMRMELVLYLASTEDMAREMAKGGGDVD